MCLGGGVDVGVWFVSGFPQVVSLVFIVVCLWLRESWRGFMSNFPHKNCQAVKGLGRTCEVRELTSQRATPFISHAWLNGTFIRTMRKLRECKNTSRHSQRHRDQSIELVKVSFNIYIMLQRDLCIQCLFFRVVMIYIFRMKMYHMTMWKQHDNVKGVAGSDEPTASAAHLGFMELSSEFQFIALFFGSSRLFSALKSPLLSTKWQTDKVRDLNV